MNILGLSGGKDSTCLALALKEKEPFRDFEYICTPTGDELPELFAHLDQLEQLLGQPIKRLGIGKSLFELIDEVQMLPNFRARWCTRILKIEPTIAYMKALPPGSVLYVGLRADEPMREGIFGDDVTCRFPFREWGWGVNEVWKFLDERGIGIPKRTDCATCYHQRIVEWHSLWVNHPELFAKGVAVEEKIGHTFRSPGRDTWPVALKDLGAAFASGRRLRKSKRDDARDQQCRVCSL